MASSIDAMVATQSGADGNIATNTDASANAELPSGSSRVVISMDDEDQGQETQGQETQGQETQGQETDHSVPPMPENGSDKFYDPETGIYNWEAHAKEAEFKLKMAKGKSSKTSKKATEEAPSEEVTEDGAREAVEDAGLDWETLGEKIVALGDIEEDDYEALENSGIPRNVVEAHIAGMKALQSQTQDAVLKQVGGKENLDRLMSWATTTLSDQERNAYNSMLNSPQWPVALDALMARAGTTNKPNLSRPGGSSVPGTDGFSSQEDFLAAIADPKYKTSEQFRRQVAQKLAVSNIGHGAKGRWSI